MVRTEVDEFLEKDFSELPTVNEILREHNKQTIFEELKEEDNLIRDLFRGKSKKAICADYRLKYPEHNDKFTLVALNRFIERNEQITKDLTNATRDVARRHFAAKVQVEEKLASLILFSEKLIQKYDGDGDSQSTLKAIDITMKSMMNYAKLAGFIDDRHVDEKPAKTVIQIVSEKHQSLAEKANKANFQIIDDTPSVLE